MPTDPTLEDDVRACGEAIHGTVYEHDGCIWLHKTETASFSEPRVYKPRYIVQYKPHLDAAQAEALDGWLWARGRVIADEHHFDFYPKDGSYPFHYDADMTHPESRWKARVKCVAELVKKGKA